MIVLGGWLLMMPTTRERPDGRFEVADKPVSQWEQFRAFDTAKECEATLAGVNSTDPSPADHRPGPFATDYEAHRAASRSGRCVPAEHVYPPTGTAQKKPN